MIPNPYPGSFFVFEGIDGCGKSLQVAKVDEWLNGLEVTERNRLGLSFGRRKPEVIRTKEPVKDSFWGKLIYKDLFDTKLSALHIANPFGFQTWYASNSKDHLSQTIKPALQLNNIVLSDRFRPSMVYGAASFEDIARFMMMNMAVIGEDFIWPDLIFIFDVSPETSLERLFQKGTKLDGFEEHSSFMRRVRDNYLYFAEHYENCHVINAERSPEEVFEEVKGHITRLLESKTS
ncbi:MAG: dTMP kinase [Candidatus Paceibacterota bacterium]